MRKPQRLEPGDRVALVAPASPFKREELEAGVEELTRIGFDPFYDERVLERSRFVAGSAETRAAVLQAAWRDPDVRAIIAIRGGFGSAQLLPLLEPALIQQSPKIFVGYSDITALLCLHVQLGITCFHGAMIEGRIAKGGEGYDRSSFLACVSDPEPAGELAPPELEALKRGEATGMLVGGTLTQIVSLLGTPWAYEPPEGSILFLEDVGERPYRVVRMLTQLAQAGVLAKAGALVFGEFRSCDEPGGDFLIRDVLTEFTRDFPGPVLFGFPSGHTSGPSWTIPFGVAATVRTTRPALLIDEAAVS